MDNKSFSYHYLCVDRGQKQLTPAERLNSAKIVLACLNSASLRDESLRQACLLGGLDHFFDSYKKLFMQPVEDGGAGYLVEEISALCGNLGITEQASTDKVPEEKQDQSDADADLEAFMDEHIGTLIRAAAEEKHAVKTTSVQKLLSERDYLWLETLQGACHEQYRRQTHAEASDKKSITDAFDENGSETCTGKKERHGSRKKNSKKDNDEVEVLDDDSSWRKRSRKALAVDADEDQQMQWLEKQIKRRSAVEKQQNDKKIGFASSNFKTGLEEQATQSRMRAGSGADKNAQPNNNAAAGHRYKRPWGNASADGGGDIGQLDDNTREAMRRIPGLLPAAAGDRTSAAAAANNNVPEELRHIDPKLVEIIEAEILDRGRNVTWSDIAGLNDVKRTLKEIIVLPMLRPDLYRGLREPAKGLLLFGPPGTGKTMIGKCIASQCRATFFCITASTLTSKWVGEGEKLVRALFAVANYRQPSVVFIDEVDSILSARSDGEHEASRRMKNEFLAQIDGANSAQEGKVLIIGATNLPQSIDSAARRRFVKRMYIPLPDREARVALIRSLLSKERHSLTNDDVAAIAGDIDKYSGADVAQVCREAAMICMRSIPLSELESIEMDEVRPIGVADFRAALQHVKPSVSDSDLGSFEEFNKKFGISSAN